MVETISARMSVPVLGFAALSNGVNGVGPLDSRTTLGGVTVPVLDVSGAGDADVANAAAEREAAYRTGPGPASTRVLTGNDAHHNFARAGPEIGSASRRERGCQYV